MKKEKIWGDLTEISDKKKHCSQSNGSVVCRTSSGQVVPATKVCFHILDNAYHAVVLFSRNIG